MIITILAVTVVCDIGLHYVVVIFNTLLNDQRNFSEVISVKVLEIKFDFYFSNLFVFTCDSRYCYSAS